MNKPVIALALVLALALTATARKQAIEIIDDKIVPFRANALPSTIIGGYICDSTFLTAQGIADAGFNVVFLSFFNVNVVGSTMTITENTCCGDSQPYELASQLIELGVIVMISSGGYGCQGTQPTGFEQLTPAAIVQGFQAFVASTGVNFAGINIDWEGSVADSLPSAINQLGAALMPQGYFVTTVPTSSQFMPGALQGWQNLNPSQVNLVQPQWYQGGCI